MPKGNAVFPRSEWNAGKRLEEAYEDTPRLDADAGTCAALRLDDDPHAVTPPLRERDALQPLFRIACGSLRQDHPCSQYFRIGRG